LSTTLCRQRRASLVGIVPLTNASGGNIVRLALDIAPTVLPRYAETHRQRTAQPAPDTATV
jgi:hypothetical protein